MADAVVILDAGGTFLSGLLALLIVRKAASAYSLTGKANLVDFSAGFFALSVSYFWLALTLLVLPFSEVGQPVRVLVGVLGFSLVALSYFTKERAGSIALLAGVVAAFVVAWGSSLYLVSFSNDAFLGMAHLLEVVLALYILFQVSRSYTKRFVPGGIFVLWGFGFLAVSQYTWVIWSYVPSDLIAELAMVIRLLGLVSLVYGLKK